MKVREGNEDYKRIIFIGDAQLILEIVGICSGAAIK